MYANIGFIGILRIKSFQLWELCFYIQFVLILAGSLEPSARCLHLSWQVFQALCQINQFQVNDKIWEVNNKRWINKQQKKCAVSCQYYWHITQVVYFIVYDFMTPVDQCHDKDSNTFSQSNRLSEFIQFEEFLLYHVDSKVVLFLNSKRWLFGQHKWSYRHFAFYVLFHSNLAHKAFIGN